MGKTSSAANAFGSGKDLIGLHHRGKKIINATRKYMFLENGDRVERKGNRVEHEEFIIKGEVDRGHYMTDDL